MNVISLIPRSGFIIVEMIPILSRFRSLGFAPAAQKEKERRDGMRIGFLQ
jgi:hypothetical protein